MSVINPANYYEASVCGINAPYFCKTDGRIVIGIRLWWVATILAGMAGLLVWLWLPLKIRWLLVLIAISFALMSWYLIMMLS